MLANVEQMYDIVYDEMVEARRAKLLEGDECIYNDRYGNPISEEFGFGEKIDTKLTHPQYLLIDEETGCNTCMKKNGNVASTKYITKKDTIPE